jgi:predicted Zn-dependent peptidase
MKSTSKLAPAVRAFQKDSLRCIYFPVPRQKTTSVHILTGGGVFAEKRGEYGLSHLLEHILVEEWITGKPRQLADILKTVAHIPMKRAYEIFPYDDPAQTKLDYTLYSFCVPAEFFDQLVPRLTAAWFNKKEFKNIHIAHTKQDVANEVTSRLQGRRAAVLYKKLY